MKYLLLISCLLFTMSCKKIEPGYVGIVVNQYGDDKGVSSYPTVSGMQWYNPIKSDILQYPTFIQTATWTFSRDGSRDEALRFSSQPGTQFSAEVSISYQLAAQKVPNFYVQFRNDDLGGFTHGFLRNVSRDASSEEANKLTDEELYANKKEILLANVRNRINQQVSKYGVEIVQLGFLSGPFPPEQVVKGINAKAAAIQDAVRVENELRSTQAEIAKSIAEADGIAKRNIIEAEGTAKANAIVNSSINSTTIEWKKLQLQKEALDKWNGELPSYMTSGGQLPFININK